jgi:hypothetical protein
VALDLELVLLEPADVELLPRRAALELPGDVLFVIADYSVFGGEGGCEVPVSRFTNFLK